MPVSVPDHGPIPTVLYFTFLLSPKQISRSLVYRLDLTGKTQAESEAEEAKSKQDLEAFTG